LAVQGDKCLEALLELSYIRDRVLYYLSDRENEEWIHSITLEHVVEYLYSPDVRAKLQDKLGGMTHLIIDEVSQVSKLLMTLVVIVIMMVKPDLNVVIGGDARQIPCPPEHKGSPNAYFFESELWDLLGVRYCEVTQYLRDPAMARVVEALADGKNTPPVYYHLRPRFVDEANVVMPQGATTLHIFATNKARNRCNAAAFGDGVHMSGGAATRIPWFVCTPPNHRPDEGYQEAFAHTKLYIERSIWRNCGLEPGGEGQHCHAYLDVFVGMRVIFSHCCECYEYMPQAAARFDAMGPCRYVGKGQLGEVVGLEQVPFAWLTQWLASNVQPGAQGWACISSMHAGAGPGALDVVYWPVVRYSNKHGSAVSVVVPHIFVRESRWLGKQKATAAIAFVPLHLGYVVNGQQMQGMTFKDRLLYLLADITEAHWLQRLAAVMVTRTTDLARLLFKVPKYVWARHKPNWFKADTRVLCWLHKCRQSGFASGHAAGPQDVAWSIRRQRVCDKVRALHRCTLDMLAGSSEQIRQWEQQFHAAGGVGVVGN
jgi:hypothetical protein